MLILEAVKVVKILNQNKKVQIVLGEGSNGKSEAINYLDFNPVLQIEDKIIINKTATTLNLGSGGKDFVVTLQSPNVNNEYDKVDGHIMKLRYTPYQFSVKSCEEQESQLHELFLEPKMLDNMPVLIGELHSMLPILVTVIRQLESKKRYKRSKIVYIMTDGGALPIHLSNHVRSLKDMGWIDGCVTIGNAFGGDLEAVNIYSGLIAAKYALYADIVIVLMGPGIVGTGTWIGHTGIEQGIIANAVSTLMGVPLSIIRASCNEDRERHQGISHHTLTVLKYICLTKNIVCYPKYIGKKFPEIYDSLSYLKNKHQLEEIDITSQDIVEMLNQYPNSITTMNRTVYDDYIYYDFVASSAYWVVNQLNSFK